MRTTRSAILAVSVSAVALAGLPSALASSPTAAHLRGSGHGTWKVKPSNPDTGTQHVVRGHGHFSIGDAKIHGSVTSPGFIANGACSVAMTLDIGDGSVGVVGHSKHTSTSYPNCIGPFRFRFHTVKASAVLAGESWKGVGHLDLENASSDATDHGSFTLKLRPVS